MLQTIVDTLIALFWIGLVYWMLPNMKNVLAGAVDLVTDIIAQGIRKARKEERRNETQDEP